MARQGRLYLDLYEKLRGEIVEGLYPYGTRFPSKRVTAENNGISLITVEHAYQILMDEGYLTASERSGYFVAYREPDLIPINPILPERPVPAQVSSPDDFLPFPLYARTVRRILSDYGERLLQRSPGEGLMELRQAIAFHLARTRSMHISPEQILIGSGAEALYSTVVQLLGRDSIYAAEDPCYEVIRLTYLQQGVRLDSLPLGPDGIRTSALLSTQARILHVTPFHSYPSGITATASKRREYIRWAHDRDGFVIEDDYDSELSPSSKPEDTLFSLSGGERVLYVNTFTRTVAPSLRTGFMVLPESLLPLFREKLGFMSCSVPVMEQVLLTELLNRGDYVRHLNRLRRARRQKAVPQEDS